MKSQPIPFNAEMVLAILEGRKTMTRRIVNPQPTNDPAKHHPIKPYRTTSGRFNWVLVGTGMGMCDTFSCPYGQPGDRLWVRETYYQFGHWEPAECPRPRTRTGRTRMRFVADKEEIRFDAPPIFRNGMHNADPWTMVWHKRHARFMPRKYARIWLEITDVRIERVQEISKEDALAEGVFYGPGDGCAWGYTADYNISGYVWDTPKAAFQELWDSINASRRYGWDANPWVWVVSFKVISTKGNQ